MTQYFEYTDEKSAKFWEITLDGTNLKTRYGKIGTDGQTTEKYFADEASAQKEYAKLVKEKTSKGYVAIGNNDSATPEQAGKPAFRLMNFAEAVQKYQLDFLPSYTKSQHENETILVYEENAHFETLDLDEYAQTHNVNALLFLQNLSATQYILQQKMDYGPTTIVLGDVSAKNIGCSGANIYFRGNLTASQSFVAGVYNHGELYVEGAIEAEITISTDHMFSYKNLSKGYIITDSICQDAITKTTYEPKDILAKKYVANIAYEGINFGSIVADMKKGKSIIATQKALSAFEKLFVKYEKSKDKYLSLFNQSLKTIPERVATLTELQQLDISANPITDFSLLTKLPNLKKLWVHYYNFSSIPKDFLQLTSLESLSLGNNALKRLPKELKNLNRLKELILEKNKFEVFPEILYELPALEVLDLTYQDADIPFKITKTFEKITTLILYANHRIAYTAPQPSLQTLNLCNCSLTHIPEAVLESKKLKKLDISLNYFAKLPEEISRLSQLESILIHETITNAEVLASLPKLKTIEISGHDVPSSLINTLVEIPSWEHLIIEYGLDDSEAGRAILSRKNLKSLMMDGSKVNIAEARREEGIVL